MGKDPSCLCVMGRHVSGSLLSVLNRSNHQIETGNDLDSHKLSLLGFQHTENVFAFQNRTKSHFLQPQLKAPRGLVNIWWIGHCIAFLPIQQKWILTYIIKIPWDNTTSCKAFRTSRTMSCYTGSMIKCYSLTSMYLNMWASSHIIAQIHWPFAGGVSICSVVPYVESGDLALARGSVPAICS